MKYYFPLFGVCLSCFCIKIVPVLGYDIGASCEYDIDCIAEHSYCQGQRTCQCWRGYVPASDANTCTATIGARCETKYDCMTLPHSDCRQNVCQCDPDFVPDNSAHECLPRVKDIRGSCLQDNQCQAGFGDQSHCYGGHCECMMRHHFLKGHCFLTKELNEFCTNSSQCYIGADFTATIECRDQSCKCITGYYADNYRKCKRSGGNPNGSKPSTSIFMILTIIYFLEKHFQNCKS